MPSSGRAMDADRHPAVGRVLAGALLTCAIGFAQPQTSQSSLSFSCETFAPSIGEWDLVNRFGAAHVRSGLVPRGGAEGDWNPGTLLFADAPDRFVQLYWRDRTAKRWPDWVRLRGRFSAWRTPAGITLGADLKTVERLNGHPFRLSGFGTDVGGTVTSWLGGRLEGDDADGCSIRFRFNPDVASLDPQTRSMLNQVTGGRDFSSGHPAMQALNPRIEEAFISYDDRTSRLRGGSGQRSVRSRFVSAPSVQPDLCRWRGSPAPSG